MNLLYSNDKPGEYPPSWYAATADLLPSQPQLRGNIRADVCVVGAGYTGLSAALHLAEMGYDVAVVDAQRIGFGASGRNGGQLGSGQRMEQDGLQKLLGKDTAKHLWQMGEEAKDLVKSLIAKHDIACHLKPGIAWTGSTPSDVAHLHDYAELLQRDYNYDQIQTLSAQECHALCPSPDYKGGTLDMGAGHLHPLKYALGLAKAALSAGAKIYENSHVHAITEGPKPVVQTDQGRVECDHIVLAANGYLGGLHRKVAARVMPINNFVAATRPLTQEERASVLTQDIAVADSRFVVNYFRLSHDHRLLFGGGESYGYKFPTDIAAKVRKPMSVIYPHLRDVPIDYAWGGTLGITMKRMPYFARLAPNILNASGYSGHGVGTATHAGQLLAQAIAGTSNGFDVMSAIPTSVFPGAGAMRTPLLILAMTWYSLRDRVGL